MRRDSFKADVGKASTASVKFRKNIDAAVREAYPTFATRFETVSTDSKRDPGGITCAVQAT